MWTGKRRYRPWWWETPTVCFHLHGGPGPPLHCHRAVFSTVNRHMGAIHICHLLFTFIVIHLCSYLFISAVNLAKEEVGNFHLSWIVRGLLTRVLPPLLMGTSFDLHHCYQISVIVKLVSWLSNPHHSCWICVMVVVVKSASSLWHSNLWHCWTHIVVVESRLLLLNLCHLAFVVEHLALSLNTWHCHWTHVVAVEFTLSGFRCVCWSFVEVGMFWEPHLWQVNISPYPLVRGGACVG